MCEETVSLLYALLTAAVDWEDNGNMFYNGEGIQLQLRLLLYQCGETASKAAQHAGFHWSGVSPHGTSDTLIVKFWANTDANF